MDPRPKRTPSDRRVELDTELRRILMRVFHTEDIHIYYQPPESVRMKYPAIVYKQNTMRVRYAGNRTYNARDEYQVTAISSDPECPLPRVIQEHFPLCSPGRKFVSDNLYHFPFTIYY